MKAGHVEILKQAKAMALKGTLTGCFSDFPIDVYHHPECPGYNSTLTKQVVSQSFNHWMIDRKKSARPLEFGNAFHVFTMEPEHFESQFKVVKTDDRKSGTWRAAKAAQEDDGRTLLDLNDWDCLQIMAKKVPLHPDVAPFWPHAKFEQTYFWICPNTGLLLKCRPDIVSCGIVFDLKSCLDASVGAFTWEMKDRLQRISSAHYLNGISAVTGIPHGTFRLIACEKIEPHEIQVHQVHELSLQAANIEINEAHETIRRILEQGESAWRGYQLGVKEIRI